jgi:hypothetical protein
LEELIEHRKSQRYLLEDFGEVVIPESGEYFGCYIYNFSEGGLMVYLNHDFKTGEQFHIKFTIAQKTFEKDCIVLASRNFTHSQKYILQIGKSLKVSYRVNIKFTEPLSIEDIEYINKNH